MKSGVNLSEWTQSVNKANNNFRNWQNENCIFFSNKCSTFTEFKTMIEQINSSLERKNLKEAPIK